MRPRRTTGSLIRQLEALGTQRHHQTVERLAALPPRVACVQHGWSPAGGVRTSNFAAVASLCPHCSEERKQKEREQAVPETQVLDLYAGSELAQRLWYETCRKMEEAGHVLPRSSVEREAVRAMDEARTEEVAALRETPVERRRRHASYWRGRPYPGMAEPLRPYRRYAPSPAKATGP